MKYYFNIFLIIVIGCKKSLQASLLGLWFIRKSQDMV